MAKAILICGKICSGKTTYARQLCAQQHAKLLSLDELMLSMFGQYLGDLHDEYARMSERYLLNKSLELLADGAYVVLDWGFWTKESRRSIRRYFEEHGSLSELHYIAIDDETWYARINARNSAVAENKCLAYYIDQNLMDKFNARFEIPDRTEVDVWLDA